MKGWHAANGRLHKSLTTKQNSFILHYTFLLPVLNCELSGFFSPPPPLLFLVLVFVPQLQDFAKLTSHRR